MIHLPFFFTSFLRRVTRSAIPWFFLKTTNNFPLKKSIFQLCSIIPVFKNLLE